MIGRGSMKTPWMFRQAEQLLRTGVAGPEPDLAEKLRIVLDHLDLLERFHGEAYAVRTLNARISWYGKTMGHVKPLKEAVRVAKSTSAIRGVLTAWLERGPRPAAVA